jgi:hypothetical protein
MAVDERRRKALYDALEQRIGSAEADTMMELLPPVGWAGVATKQDLETLRHGLTAEMERGLRRVIQWNVGTVIAVTGVVLAITRLAS